MLKFENVSKVYDGGFQAVKSVNFEIQKGNYLFLSDQVVQANQRR